TLLETGPAICAWTPHELLPIMPPRVQYLWVAGSGPNVRPYLPAALRRSSRTQPGRTRAILRTASISRISLTYLLQSSTIAVLQHCPARLVPAPRERMGAPNSRE